MSAIDEKTSVNDAAREHENAGGGIAGYVNEHPFAAGAIALGIGAVVGLAVPLSKTENELLGEVRDSLVEGAQAVAEEAVERAQRVAEKAVDVAADEATKQGLIV